MVEQTNIVHSGELYKQAVSSSLKNWKWRTITLTPEAIFWGKKDVPYGKLDLTTDTVVTTETGVSTWYTGYQLKITTPAYVLEQRGGREVTMPGGALVLYSSSEGIRDHWVAVIENTVKALNRPELLKRGSAIVAGLFGGAKDNTTGQTADTATAPAKSGASRTTPPVEAKPAAPTSSWLRCCQCVAKAPAVPAQ